MSIHQKNIYGAGILLLLLSVAAPGYASEYRADEISPFEPQPKVSRAGDPRHEQIVNDLAYGSSLYNFFQDKKLAAITDLTAAKEKAALQNSPADAELLLASLYFDYGLIDEAQTTFTRLLDSDTSGADKNRVWFNLARVQYANDDYQQAKTLLARIDHKLSPQREAEKLHIQTNLFIQGKDFENAKKTVASIDPENIWRAYSEYNLGIALTTENDSQEGAAWLKKLSTRDASDEELLSLQDSARLTLALSALKQNRPDEAIAYFGDIRVSGPLSNTALLGTGWAWSRKSEPGKALTYWQALTEKNQADDASLEAYLAIAYAFEQLDNKALSAQYYDSAAQRYEQLLQVMDMHIDSIERMELIDTLYKRGLVQSATGGTAVQDSNHQETQSYRASAILLHMIVSDPFQQALQDYHELNEIENSLALWKNNLPVLELMLAERRAVFNNKRPAVEQASDLDRLKILQQQRDLLAEQVDSIRESQDRLEHMSKEQEQKRENIEEMKTLLAVENDMELQEVMNALKESSANATAADAEQEKIERAPGIKPQTSARSDSTRIPQGFLALASVEESEHLEQLFEVDVLLSKLQDKQDLAAQQRKYELLYGMLYWDIVTQYPQRYWRVQHQLQSLDRALLQAESAARSLKSAAKKNEQSLDDFARRIKGQDEEIKRLETLVKRLIQQQQEKINQLAIEAIESRKSKLEQFRLSARYSLARVYDEISRQRAAP